MLGAKQILEDSYLPHVLFASSLQSTLSPRMATRPGNGGAAYSVSLADQADPVMTEILVEQSWLIALGLFLAVAVGIAVWTHKMPG